MSDKGWIKLYRQILDCDIWVGFDDVDVEPFDKRSAWIDLLLRANHSDKQFIFNYEPITVTRGQLITSVRKLSTRWGWSVTKTYKYLSLLEELGMIKKESDSQKTLLTLINYEIYQGVGNTEETQTKHKRNADETQNGHKQEYKELKNEKNINIRHKYGQYSNVLLTDEDYDKLVKEFPNDYKDRIERLSEYIASTGKSYKSHLATIRAWSRKDKPTTKKQNAFNSFPQQAYDYEALEKQFVNR